MRAVLWLLAAAASAQTGEDARPLVESIAHTVTSAGSVRAEGVIVRESAGPSPSRTEARFEVETQGPLLTRYHEVNSRNSILLICDGASRWTYTEPEKSYTRTTADEAACAPPMARWGDLADYLASARVTGQDHSEFEGGSRACLVVETSYEEPNPRTGGAARAGPEGPTLCIDPARRMVLRERILNTTTVTYTRVEYRPPQSAEVFQFHPPPGSSQGGVSLPLMGEGGVANYAGLRNGGGPAPLVKVMRPPQYTPEALQAGLEGTVLVSLVVDEEGQPQNVRVVRGLGMGLDEKAIEAVSGWRFKPGVSGGLPAAWPLTVGVTFRLP